MRGYLKSAGLEAKFKEMPVFDAWIEVVGVDLARRARPVRFQAGELIVEVESAAHRQELASYTGETFRKLANQKLVQQGLGHQSIDRVSFKLKR
jgi:hypothetical protein